MYHIEVNEILQIGPALDAKFCQTKIMLSQIVGKKIRYPFGLEQLLTKTARTCTELTMFHLMCLGLGLFCFFGEMWNAENLTQRDAARA